MNKLKQDQNLDFATYRNSPDGQIEQSIIWDNLQKYLHQNSKENILDASCGEGWLAEKLLDYSPNIFACDISETLIKKAQAKNLKINFSLADLTKPLSFTDNFFDTIVWNLGVHDIQDLTSVFKNFKNITKPEGQLIINIANPYYSYPVGFWKRGLKKIWPKSKPELKLSPYTQQKNNSPFSWGQGFNAYFHTLPDIINPCLQSGFSLTSLEELTSKTDSTSYNRQYQLFRFPMMLLLIFKKTSK